MGETEKEWTEDYRRSRQNGAEVRDSTDFEEKHNTESRVYESTGNCVLGPALNSFVTWVLESAMKTGKKRLYFLARDGYLMYHAAKIYVEGLSLPIDCRYVSCSRYSLRLPLFHLDLDEAMEYICRGGIGVSLKRIMNRAGLEEKDQEKVLDETGETGRENEEIPYCELKQVKEKLKNSRCFVEALNWYSKEAIPTATGYLAQSGFLDGTPDALVDSGWTGSMQKSMKRLLEYMGRTEPLEGYYWGLYELPRGVRREEYHCYYFSPEGQLREKVYFNNNLFETVFSAPHGMTMGYRKAGERYEPVYAPVSEERVRQMKKLEDVLLKYIVRAAEMTADTENGLTGKEDCRDERKAVGKLLRMFMTEPTKEEADVYGSMAFCDDVLEYGGRRLAEVMDEQELKSNHVINKILVMTGFRRQTVKESAWYEGSAVRSSEKPGVHLFQYRLYKYLLCIRQMYMWRKDNVQNRQG